jgi:CheY-like chemotaxis protein
MRCVGGHGELVAEQARASQSAVPAVPVIALSGASETQNQRLPQAPFACKLLKPVDPRDLCREILEIVRG